MIRGNIAIPDRDPKTRRAEERKRRPQPAIASAIVTPAKVKGQTGSAIVEPKRRPSNAMLAHLLNHKEHRRRGDLAHELFREFRRRTENNG